jgi:quercetin dioxygenase-like cupin family protein
MSNAGRQPSSRLAAHLAGALAVGLLLAAPTAADQTVARAPLGEEQHSGQHIVLSTGTTVTGEPIRYPTGAPAHVTAVELVLAPGQQTGWHKHPVPLFGYILEGELTVDYGPKGQRTYRKGDGLMEAMNEAHNGRNTGQEPLKILVVIMGADGEKGSVPASPPPRPQ